MQLPRPVRLVRPVRPAQVVGAAFLAVYAWWAVGLPPFSTQATVAVVVAGATATVVGAWTRQPTPVRDVAGTAKWAALALVAAAWEVAALLQQPRDDHPTVSSLTNELLDSQVTRAAACVLWIVAARELARYRRRAGDRHRERPGAPAADLAAPAAAAAVGLQIAARRRGAATFGDAMAVTLRWSPARIVVLAAWLWLGWHFLVRVDW